MLREPQLVLEDIVAACDKVERYTSGMTLAGFVAGERTYDAVLHNLELVGEAAKRVPPDVQARIPGIEWRKICGLRDVLAHASFGIDAAIVWDVVATKVAPLSRAIRAYLVSGGPR